MFAHHLHLALPLFLAMTRGSKGDGETRCVREWVSRAQWSEQAREEMGGGGVDYEMELQ